MHSVLKTAAVCSCLINTLEDGLLEKILSKTPFAQRYSPGSTHSNLAVTDFALLTRTPLDTRELSCSTHVPERQRHHAG